MLLATVILVLSAPLASAACTPGPNQVAFYEHPNFQGKCAVLGVGRYKNAEEIGIANDSISSVKLGSGVWAVSYEHPEFRGMDYRHEKSEDSFRPIELPLSSYPNLYYNHGDKASSVEVMKIKSFATDPNPIATYLGNYPSDHVNVWSDSLQGIGHDQSNWFFTQTKQLWKFPVGFDLNRIVKNPLPAGVKRASISKSLKDKGYDHFGDLVHHKGYLFIPLEAGEGANNQRPLLAVYRAQDLGFVGWTFLDKQTKAGWLAINPKDGLLYSSNNNLSNLNKLISYEIDYAGLNHGQVKLTYRRMKPLYDEQGREITLKPWMQGGEFSEDGKFLFLVNGRASARTLPKDGGIWIFDFMTGKKVLKSSGSMPFRFEYHPGAPNAEEPEGITYWNLPEGVAPKIEGNLHVILLNNNLRTDGIWLKHYRIGDIKSVDPKKLTAEQIAKIQAAQFKHVAKEIFPAKTRPQREESSTSLKPNLTGGVVRPPMSGAASNGLGAPSNLKITNVGRTTLTLSWRDNSTKEFGVEVYRVDGHAARRGSSGSWKFLMLSQERDSLKVRNTGVRSDEDFDLSPNTVYCYKLRSYIGFSRDQVSSFTKEVCSRTLP